MLPRVAKRRANPNKNTLSVLRLPRRLPSHDDTAREKKSVTKKAYVAKHVPLSEFVRVRNHDYHLTVWGQRTSPVLFLLHGWGDCGASFQFLVDALSPGWCVIAPDWRGFGRTESSADVYFFPDYLADLDALLHALSPEQPATLIGHSMGGNIASLYSGVNPARVDALVNIEGFGLRDRGSDEAPARLRQWLGELRSPPEYRTYRHIDELRDRIMKRSPRLEPEKAAYVAELWSSTRDGSVVLRANPAHKLTNPVLYRREEARACWRSITARTLLVVGAETYATFRDGLTDVAACVPGPPPVATIANSGHMIHFEQPEALAGQIEAFLGMAH